jgi:spermidine synthase
MHIITAYIITFIASFCMLVIEIVAGRILAPFVGVSLYTWTSIIGVVLAGISLGAFFGGKLADRYPGTKTLGWLLLLSGIATLTIAPVTSLVATYSFKTTLMMRIVIVTSLTFFIPSCIIGMISPVVVKLTLINVETAGNVVGRIYAVSTLGSIIGTFTAGFFLISVMGTRNIIMTMGGILVITSLASGFLFRSKKLAAATFLFPVFLLWGIYGYAFKPPMTSDTVYYKESDYYTIKVKNAKSADGKTPLKSLVLDNLIHSYVNPADPFHIEYRYEKIYSDVLTWRFGKDIAFRSLTIGAGGYTFPRYMEVFYPNARLDVVEIDPEVTKISYDYLGLPRNTRIRSYNEDGRWYVMNSRDSYDVVFFDAYNDLSIPYHLTTREFAQMVRDRLNPNGVVLTNIIDNFQNGSFLPSYIRTLREVFGEKNVHLIAISPLFEKIRISTFIVLATKGNLAIHDFAAFMKKSQGDEANSAVVPEEIVNRLLERNYSVVLTDDFAPVDNLIAPVFELRFGYNKREQS